MIIKISLIWMILWGGWSCKTPGEKSAVRVTRGTAIDAASYKSLPLLERRGLGNCSGSVVKVNTFLSAAHCFYHTIRFTVASSKIRERVVIRQNQMGDKMQYLVVNAKEKLDQLGLSYQNPMYVKMWADEAMTDLVAQTAFKKLERNNTHQLTFYFDDSVALPEHITTVELHLPLSRSNLTVYNRNPQQIIIHPDYIPSGAVSPFDIGLLIFPQSLTDRIYFVDNIEPKPESDVVLVGYGRTKVTRAGKEFSESTGQLRFGLNTIDEVGPFITLTGASSDDSLIMQSASAPGDSGSPLFSSETSKIVGVCSGGALFYKGESDNGQCKIDPVYCEKKSFYVNLLSPAIRSFLTQHQIGWGNNSSE